MRSRGRASAQPRGSVDLLGPYASRREDLHRGSSQDAPGFLRRETVGRKIRQLRKDRHHTQTELASRKGIHQSDLSRMEKGHYRDSLDTLLRILGELNVGIGEFFGEIGSEDMSPRQMKLLREFGDLSTEAQLEVEEFIAFKKMISELSRKETKRR